jgi:hypothetical protein
MTFPLLIENAADIKSQADLLAWIKSEAPNLKSQLDATGAILFRGFPVDSTEAFDDFSAAFDYEDFTYQDSLSNAVRINLTPRVFTANEAPQDIEIYLHHEMAQTPLSPEKIFFCCLQSAEQGGETPVCRSDEFYAAFKEKHPIWADQFETLGLKYTMQMPFKDDTDSGQGRSWRSTLGVQSIADAEQKLAELGYSWQWQEDKSLLTVTPALPAVHSLPDGSQSFFNQLVAAHLGWKAAIDNLDKVVTFGNEDSIPIAALDAIVKLVKQFTYPIAWQNGDVALVDNRRVMHGRYPYNGALKRQVLVCLAR